MRPVFLALLVVLHVACLPPARGIFQELPLPADPAAREVEEQARSLLRDGEDARSSQDWEAAEQKFREAIALRKSLFGESNSYTDEAQLKLAGVMLAQGHFNDALPLLAKVRHSVLKVKQGNEVIRSEIAFDLAQCYKRIGHKAYSDELFREAYQVRRQLLGSNHVDTQVTEFWMHFACGTTERPSFDEKRLYVLISNLSESLNKESKRDGFITRHQSVSFCTWLTAHHVLAKRLIKTGNIQQLHKLLNSGEDSVLRWFAYCTPLVDYKEMQGDIYTAIGETEKAWGAYSYAINQMNNIARPRYSYGILLNRDRLRLRWGQFRQVSLYQGLARVHMLKGEHSEAEEIFNKAAGLLLQGRTSLDITEHQTEQSFHIMAEIAETRWLQRKYPLAVATWANALDVFEARFRKLAIDQTELALLMQLWGVRHMADSIYSTLYVTSHTSERRGLVEVALTTALLMQGRATDEMANQLPPVELTASSQSKEIRKQLASLRMRYAALEYQTISNTADEQYTRDKQALLTEEATLEQQLRVLGISARHQQDIPGRRQIISELQARLPKNGLLVQYILFQESSSLIASNKQHDRKRYMALTLRKDGGSDAVDLGDAAIIEEAILKLRSALMDNKMPYETLMAKRIYDLIVRPLLPFINKKDSIYIVPDGQLHLLPFGLLYGDQCMLGDTNQIFYLSSGRDLLRKPTTTPATNVVAFANPDLDSISQVSSSAVLPDVDSPFEASRVMNLRRTPTGLELHGLSSLKHAEKEAEDIREIFPQAQTYILAAASEQRLTNLSEAPGILHFATHGVFLSDSSSEQKPGGRGYLAREYEPPPTNPLLRSMLLLAGARSGRAAEDSTYDGLATALELSSLPLKGTQLVVLSACESGLGEVAPGEGVAGLRRAFMVAGAETVVASLWKVNDAVTRELMKSFYGYLRDGEGRAEAMQHAAQDIREQYPHPYYWASFIVIGQGGPLRGMTN